MDLTTITNEKKLILALSVSNTYAGCFGVNLLDFVLTWSNIYRVISLLISNKCGVTNSFWPM